MMTGLQYLHANGFLYCDLKPNTCLVDEYGVVKLSDFGLARRIPGTSGASPKAAPKKRGCPYYMSPELFLEEVQNVLVPLLHSARLFFDSIFSCIQPPT
jgi:serine/threonine protein kinase